MGQPGAHGPKGISAERAAIVLPSPAEAGAGFGSRTPLAILRLVRVRRRREGRHRAAVTVPGFALVTRQIMLPTSSATSRAPLLSIATPTGRP
jgi:hypothetical protein